MTTKLGKLLSGTAAASILAFAAGAARAQGETPFDIAMIDDQIIVTGERAAYANARTTSATRTDTALIDIPQSISVINRDLIDDQAFRSLADLSRYVPGLGFGLGEGHRDAPVLRGNQSTADLFIDGVRDDAEYFRDFYNVERVEVLKGPNAMIFGRGAGGGLINRVTRKADFKDVREIALGGGQFASGRAGADIGGAVSDNAALRLNAFYENSASHRDFVGRELFGINPTGALRLGEATTLRLSYEYVSDRREVDRGVPSLNGRPVGGDRSAFFGNPDASRTTFDRHAVVASLERSFSDLLSFRNSLSLARNDKFYANAFAGGPVAPNGDVPLISYASSQDRDSLFNQSDFILKFAAGPFAHTVLIGAEVGLQDTENFRTPNNANGVVNIAAPTTFAPGVFTGVQNDNQVDLNVVGVYVQDQIEIGRHFQLIGGARFDRFDLEFDDRRPGQPDFARVDGVFSPRGGVVFKPVDDVALYFSYAKSFLPQSGDQFSTLTATLAALEPEIFENLEIGAKWNITSRLEFAAALYQLDRENTRAVDPVTLLTALTGAQRTEGVEASLTGSLTDKWEIVAGYAYQNAEITSATTAAPAGRALALTPEHSFSLWSTYQVLPRWRVGAGVIHQGDRFASLSNAVTLPDFTRIDAAVYYTLSESIDLQVNVENIGNTHYFPTAHNDNNILPGAPRNVRASLTARF